MPVPFILLAFGAATAITGAAFAIDGVGATWDAQDMADAAMARHREAAAHLSSHQDGFNRQAGVHGQLKLDVVDASVLPYVALMKRLCAADARKTARMLERIDLTPHTVRRWSHSAESMKAFATGGFKAVGAGALSGQAVVGLVGAFGSASTGTAIGGLGGAAATNATLAWLGGGSLAAGGGGMALGATVLNGLMLGPALLVGGLVLSSQGQKALSQAREYEARVDDAIHELGRAHLWLDAAMSRMQDLSGVLRALSDRAAPLLKRLARLSPENALNDPQFATVSVLLNGIVRVLQTPLLDAQGNLNPKSLDVVLHTRRLL